MTKDHNVTLIRQLNTSTELIVNECLAGAARRLEQCGQGPGDVGLALCMHVLQVTAFGLCVRRKEVKHLLHAY
jgi:hypothetical protein